MIVFLTLIYVAVLFVLVKMKVLPNTNATWMSTIVWMAVLFLFLFIPMQWGAPSGPVKVLTRVVQIIPNVSGQVVEVAVEANEPLTQGDLLFQLDPEPFQIAVALAEASLARVEAQVKQDQDSLASANASLFQAESRASLAQQRFDDDAKLVQSGTISQNRLEQRQTDLDTAVGAVDQARAAVSAAEIEIGAVTKGGVIAKLAEAVARLEQAQWNLDQTSVRAPSDGYVTNLALGLGQRVTTLPLAPAMVFVDTSEKVIQTDIHQIYLRHLEPGQTVELAFKSMPGKILFGTIDQILDVSSQGQASTSGAVFQTGQIVSEPFAVKIVLDNPEDYDHLSPGTAGNSAIYTNSMAATHVIRKVMIRMTSNLNFLNPAL